MTYYRFPENKLVKLCFLIFLYALQVVARSTMYSSSIFGFFHAQYIMIGLVVLIGTLFLIYNRKQWKQIFLRPAHDPDGGCSTGSFAADACQA